MRPQAEAWPLCATLLGGHPCGPVWLPRLAGGHGGVSRPWVPISSPSPRTLSQPGDICVVRAQAVLPVPQFPLFSTPGEDGGDARAPGSWRSRGVPVPPVAPAWMGFLGVAFWGAVVGTSPILPLGGCLLGGCVTARGQRDTGWGRVCEGTRSWEVTARHGTRLVRKAERKAKRGWGQGRGQAELSPLPGVATAAPSRRRGGPGARLPALCPAFLALFSFFSPPPPPRDALSNLSIYGQEVRSTGRLRGHPGRGTQGVTHLGDAATPRWGGHSGAGWEHLGMAPRDPRHLSKGL